MTFPVVLARKSLRADRTYKRPLISVSTEMGAQVVGTCETLGTQIALEGGGVLLDSLVACVGARPAGHCKAEEVVSVGRNGVCG